MIPRRLSTVVGGLALLTVITTSASAQWAAQGVALAPYRDYQNNQVAISDGLNGSIIAWQDDGTSSPTYRGIYLQRIDASGALQWSSSVFFRSGGAFYPAILSDGNGGAFIAWDEYRSGTDYDVYANHVDKYGAKLWGTTGVIVSSALQPQYRPAIAPDNAGGIIVAWQDQRSGPDDIYVQHLNSAGTATWTANGVALCVAADVQERPRIVTDGAGGAIVAWTDYRTVSYNSDVYARRITSAGSPQWTANGVAVCATVGYQTVNSIVSDGAGGVILAWDDPRSGSYDIYAQRLNGSGTALWAANGLVVSNATGDQWSSQLASNGTGGAYVVWEDHRSGAGDIYAAQLSASGIFWTNYNLCTATGDQREPAIAPDGAGGFVTAWADYRSGSGSIYSNRVGSDGSIFWGTGGTLVANPGGTLSGARVCTDLRGGAFVVWQDRTVGSTVYCGRVTSPGTANPQDGWISDGSLVGRGTGVAAAPAVVPDPIGGTYYAWSDTRTNAGDIYLQHLNAAGFVAGVWPVDGLNVSAVTGLQTDPALAADGSNVVVSWQDARSGAKDIYAQMVSRDGGHLQYAANGVVVCNYSGDQRNPDVATDNHGAFVVAWEDSRVGPSFSHIYAQRLTTAGPTWTANGIVVENAQPGFGDPRVVPDNGTGFIIAATGSYVTARHFTAGGVSDWWSIVANVQGLGGDGYFDAVSDGQGGAYLGWEPAALLQGGGSIRRIAANGTYPAGWSSSVPAFCGIYGWLSNIELAPDGSGGVLAAGIRGVSTDLVVTRFLADGTRATGWTACGNLLATGVTSKGLAADGQGGALIASSRGSGPASDVYVNRVLLDGSGDPAFPTGGRLVCSAVGSQDGVTMVAGGTGNEIVAWRDGREGTVNSVYTGRVQFTPDVVPPAAITDLLRAMGHTTAALSWTSPGDDGNLGTATAFDLRFSTSVITDATFNQATVIPTGPPGPSGQANCASVTGLSQCTPYWFAIKSMDDVGNWSSLSNVVQGTAKCSGPEIMCAFGDFSAHESQTASEVPMVVELGLRGANPARRAFAIAYGVPASQHGDHLQLEVFDVAGRRVRQLKNEPASPGRFEDAWDLNNETGRRVSAGMYFIRLSVGTKALTQRVLVLGQ